MDLDHISSCGGGGREENISINVRIFWASRNDALTAAKRLREKTNKNPPQTMIIKQQNLGVERILYVVP